MFKIKITKKLFANKKIKKRKEKSNSGAKRVYWIQIESMHLIMVHAYYDMNQTLMNDRAYSLLSLYPHLDMQLTE